MSNMLEIKSMKDWISNLELKDIQCEQFEQRMELFREKCSKNESQNKSFSSSNHQIRGMLTACTHLEDAKNHVNSEGTCPMSIMSVDPHYHHLHVFPYTSSIRWCIKRIFKGVLMAWFDHFWSHISKLVSPQRGIWLFSITYQSLTIWFDNFLLSKLVSPQRGNTISGGRALGRALQRFSLNNKY